MRTELYYTVIINEIDKLLGYLDRGNIVDLEAHLNNELEEYEEYYALALDLFEDTEFRLVTETLSTKMRNILLERSRAVAAEVDKYNTLIRFYTDLLRIVVEKQYDKNTIYWYLDLYKDYILDEQKLLYGDIAELLKDEDIMESLEYEDSTD